MRNKLTKMQKEISKQRFQIQTKCHNLKKVCFFSAMISQCRLCGDEKPLSELIITLQSESQKVTLIDLIEYFCRVQVWRFYLGFKYDKLNSKFLISDRQKPRASPECLQNL